MVLYHHKYARGNSAHCFGTPGMAATFLGTKKSEMSRCGKAALNLFRQFAKCNYVLLYHMNVVSIVRILWNFVTGSSDGFNF